MNHLADAPTKALALAGVIVCASSVMPASAQECGDEQPFGACRALIEINSSDGDIGFHWLADGADLNSTRIDDPNGAKVFENGGFGPLREQKLTETFGESAEPLCWDDGDVDPDEIVTLRDFREIWAPGTYQMSGKADQGSKSAGEAELTYYLPAAPVNLTFNEITGVIGWQPGTDLGNCTPAAPDSLQMLVDDDVLDALPANVPVLAWEVVLEPDVDDTDPRAGLAYRTRVAGPLVAPNPATVYQVTVSAEYILSLDADTPVKIEVGAIGGDFTIDGEGEVDGDSDNATFTEVEGFCVNESAGCD